MDQQTGGVPYHEAGTTPLSNHYSKSNPFFLSGGAEMNNLEKAHLKRICDKYGVDYYEIDSSLTYWESCY